MVNRYLTPEGNKMKEEYDLYEEEELLKIVKDLDIKYKQEDIKSKEDLVYLIIKKERCLKNES